MPPLTTSLDGQLAFVDHLIGEQRRVHCQKTRMNYPLSAQKAAGKIKTLEAIKASLATLKDQNG